MPLTAAEVVQHPGFENVIWNLPTNKKGKVTVARSRGGPFDIAYEVHGTGPIHLVVSKLCLPLLFMILLCLVTVVRIKLELLSRCTTFEYHFIRTLKMDNSG